MDATLTATGIIATILSVFFAIAAYFVQRKKNLAASDKKYPGGEALGGKASVVTTRHGLNKEKARQSALLASHSDADSSSRSAEETGAQKPVFKKYTASGGYQDDTCLRGDDEALWE